MNKRCICIDPAGGPMAFCPVHGITRGHIEPYGLLSDEIERRILAMMDSADPNEFYDKEVSPFIRQQLGKVQARRSLLQ